MSSKVYFIKTNIDDEKYYEKISKIIEKTGFYNNLEKNEDVIIKIHGQDLLDTPYISSKNITQIKKRINDKNCNGFLLDSNTLYHTKLDNYDLKDKLNQKGFDNVIYDDSAVSVKINNGILKDVEVIKKVNDSQAMIVISHFKGHSMISFSGALKNVATGCINLNGQIKLHKLVQPIISKITCLACNVCMDVCPEKAINIDSTAHINKELCTGCNICISSCPKNAIKINKINSKQFMKGLSESSYATLNNKKDNKVLFINTLINIKPYYDCNINAEKVLAKDIGILASNDCVALDKASNELINEEYESTDSNENFSENIFQNLWINVDGSLQVKYAEELKLGTQDYELIEL